MEKDSVTSPSTDEPTVGVPVEQKSWLEEYKELGQEYRYRDQMMVTEFQLTLIAIGVILNLSLSKEPSWELLAIQVIAGLFLFVIARHLDHINQDRRAALDRREVLRKLLRFEKFHLGAGRKRISAPRTMIWFVAALVPAWALWVAKTLTVFLQK